MNNRLLDHQINLLTFLTKWDFVYFGLLMFGLFLDNLNLTWLKYFVIFVLINKSVCHIGLQEREK